MLGTHHILSGFLPSEPIVRVRNVHVDANVRNWDYASDTVEEYAYNENDHSSWVLPFDIEMNAWVVSARTKRRYLWLPQLRRTIYDCMDVHEDRVAIGSMYGILTLLDMSRLQGD
jgi:hypothetical protein